MRIFAKHIKCSQEAIDVSKEEANIVSKPILILGCLPYEDDDTFNEFKISIDLFGWSENIFLCAFNEDGKISLDDAIEVKTIPISLACDRIRAIQEQSRNGYDSPEALVFDNRTGVNTVMASMKDSIVDALKAMILEFGTMYTRVSGEDHVDLIIEVDNHYENMIDEFSDKVIEYLTETIPTIKHAKEQGLLGDGDMIGVVIRENF